MTANATLTGFPPIDRLRFFQGSTTEPGRLIVDTMVVGPDTLSRLPRFTSLTINGRNFTGTWDNLRVVKLRVRYGRTRVVLKDSRWRLDTVTLGNNYNRRDSLGNLMTGNQKNIPALLQEIGELTGITFTAGELPGYLPRARWAGLSAREGLEQLLRDTGCRMVYDPVSATYKISIAGTGYYPDLAARTFRPGPPPNVKEVVVKSAPVLYEDKMDCTAKQINATTGETEAVSASTLPATPTETQGQTRFRLWEADAVTHPENLSLDRVLFNDHRAKSHIPDPSHPTHERARIIPDEWDMFPHHQPLYTPTDNVAKLIELTGGGNVFITDHPVLMRSGATLSKMAKLLTSYYVVEADGSLRREEKTQPVDGASDDTVELEIDWLKTVNSTQSDVSGGVWDTLHQDVLAAVSKRYLPDSGNGPETVLLRNPIDLQGSGQVGGVDYYLNNNQYRPRMDFRVAFNFTPAAQGNIR